MLSLGALRLDLRLPFSASLSSSCGFSSLRFPAKPTGLSVCCHASLPVSFSCKGKGPPSVCCWFWYELYCPCLPCSALPATHVCCLNCWHFFVCNLHVTTCLRTCAMPLLTRCPARERHTRGCASHMQQGLLPSAAASAGNQTATGLGAQATTWQAVAGAEAAVCAGRRWLETAVGVICAPPAAPAAHKCKSCMGACGAGGSTHIRVPTSALLRSRRIHPLPLDPELP